MIKRVRNDGNNERTVIYKLHSVETRRIEIMMAVQVKKALKPIWEFHT